MVENAWRMENCPEEYPMANCPNPFEPCVCEGHWTCDDIFYITEELISYYDTNDDEGVNSSDNIDEDHLAIL